ncbi:MAG: NAD(P)/FAD-dependent oxidoreductase [Alphaproteobacteria bacterium]|nr:NAD(P)/FAD-dependent oxidoreductase [Alphaproteobacteria bacterium]
MSRRLLIVGGGPVGLFTAIHARLRGLEAVVLEQAHPDIDKGCGEGLMPRGVATLRAAGVEPDPDGVHLFTGIRYLDGERIAEGDFPEGPGLGIRRLHLHRALVARARALDVDLRFGVRVEALRPGGLRTSEGDLDGALVVGADGLHSRVRKWAGLHAGVGSFQRFGVRQHFRMRPWTDRVEVYWAQDCEAYVTPVGPERVGVAFLWSGGKARFPELLARFPALAARVEGQPPDSQARGAGPLNQRVRSVLQPAGPVPVALVGDAAGYLDAITGEGLTLGFHQAEALVQAFQEERLGDYPAAWRGLVRVPFLMIRLLLLIEQRPWLRRRVVAALGQEPELFGRMLAVNDGSLMPWDLGLAPGARLVGRVIAG